MSKLEYVVWKEEYSVGVVKFDKQHREILSLINDLYNATHKKQSRAVVWKSLTELQNYTITHLTEEEAMLERCGYPDFDDHKKVHDLLREKTEELVVMHRTSGGDLSYEVLDFLKEWWTKHIMVMDRKYTSCLARR